MKYLRLFMVLILSAMFIQVNPALAEKKVNIMIKYKQNVETMAVTKERKFKLDVLSVPISEKDNWIRELNKDPEIQYAEVDQPAFYYLQSQMILSTTLNLYYSTE